MNILKKAASAGAHLVNNLIQVEAQHNPEKIITPGMPELLRSIAAFEVFL